MCKFESSQKDESRWQSTDSSKAYRNTSAFKCAIKHVYSKQSVQSQFESACISLRNEVVEMFGCFRFGIRYTNLVLRGLNALRYGLVSSVLLLDKFSSQSYRGSCLGVFDNIYRHSRIRKFTKFFVYMSN